MAVDGPRQLPAPTLHMWMAEGRPLELIDVRTTYERDIASIQGSRLLDETLYQALLKLDRATCLVFQCHHGIRSQAAAEHFVQQGFTNVHNLVGGIEAWSVQVDPSVGRY